MNWKVFMYLILKNILWSLTIIAIVLGFMMFDRLLSISDNLNNITMSVFTKLATIRYESAKKNLEQIHASSLAIKSSQSQLIATDNKSEQLFTQEMEKKAKYKAYYHKPERCDPPSTHEIRVACVNENMRAKAKFEELYQQGKL